MSYFLSSTYFLIGDLGLSDGERALISRFVSRLRKKSKIERKLSEFQFAEIFSGLSPTRRLRVRATGTHQYFIKIGPAQAIVAEHDAYNFASARIESNKVAQLESLTPIFDKPSRSEATLGLLAYSYLEGGTLFERYPDLSSYDLIEAIDKLFSRVLSTFHNFSDARQHKAIFASPPELDLDKIESMLRPVDVSDYHYMSDMYSALIENIPIGLYPHGACHGDLHLENIISLSGNDLMLIDFGLLREDTCQLNDFAEFEIALVCCAMSHEPALAATIDENLYGFADSLRVAGTSKLCRGVQAVRGNMLEALRQDRKFAVDRTRPGSYDYDGVCSVYSLLLLRYSVAYFLVSERMFGSVKSVSVRTALRRIFGLIGPRLLGIKTGALGELPRDASMRRA